MPTSTKTAPPSASTTLVRLADMTDPKIQQIVESFPEEMRDTIRLTKEEADYLVRALSGSSYGIRSRLPMVCGKDKCPFKNICVFYQMGIAPEGKPCPEEVMFIEKAFAKLASDMMIDLENIVELDISQEYMDAMIQEHRAQRHIAVEGDIVDVVVGKDVKGKPVYDKGEHPMMQAKERAQKRKEKIRKEMVLSREARLRYKLETVDDNSSRQAELKRRAEESKRRAQQQIEDADFTEEERDQ